MSIKIIALRCVFGFVSSFLFTTAMADVQASFYVSPDGDDGNPGTQQQPFRTITRARDQVRQINSTMTGDIEVNLRGGTYCISDTIMFDAHDSASNGYSVRYQAYPGETPVISGGKRITGWQPHQDGIFKAEVDIPIFRQLYVNGRRAQRARTPNAGERYRQLRFWDTKTKDIILHYRQAKPWANFEQVEIIVQMAWAEAVMRLEAFSIYGDDGYLTVKNPERDLVFSREAPPKMANQAYHLENAYEFIDQPGEWYLDTKNHTVYYKPKPGEAMADTVVVAPAVETLVKIEGSLDQPVRGIEFVGLQFSEATWTAPSRHGHLNTQAGQYYCLSPNGQPIHLRPPGAFSITAAEKIRLERNSFYGMGATAIDMNYGVANVEIVGNIICDIAGNGILIGRFYDTEEEHGSPYNPKDIRDICRKTTISNNLITRIGSDYPGCVGIACGYTQDIVIEHNKVYDLPYSGISVGWGWTATPNAMQNNIVRFNHIHHVLRMLCDGGGIYTLSRQPGTHLFENYIHHIEHAWMAIPSECNGIFLDQGSDEITIENNSFDHIEDRDIRLNSTEKLIFIHNETHKDSARVEQNAGLEQAYKDLPDRLASFR